MLANTERIRRVTQAYDALVDAGHRPTQYRVLAYLNSHYGRAFSMRELSPILRYLNGQRVAAAGVAKVVKAYAALDVVQREAAMALMKAVDASPGDVAAGGRIGNMQEAEGGAA